MPDPLAQLVEREQLSASTATSSRVSQTTPAVLLIVTLMVSQSGHATFIRARSIRVRPPPHPARQGQGRGLPPRGEAGRPRGRPDRRARATATRTSTPSGSTTSCSASSRRSATRAVTSPRPPRWPPDSPRPRPASSSTASAPRGLEAVNQAASRVRGGFEDLILAGGVESMSRVPMGSDGGAWASDPATALTTGFVPQGIGADLIATLEGWTRDDVDAYAAESHHRAAKAWANGYFASSVIPVKDLQRRRRARPRRADPSRHHARGAGRPQAELRPDRAGRRLRRRGAREVPLGREDRPRPPRRQLLRHRRRLGAGARSATSRSAPTSA